MERERIRDLLERVSRGKATIDEALNELRLAPLDGLGFANVDLHRALRCGFPEVIYGPGKTTEEIVEIAGRLRDAEQPVLITRVGPEVHEALASKAPAAVYHPPRLESLRIIELRREDLGVLERPGDIVVTREHPDAGFVASMHGSVVAKLPVHRIGVLPILVRERFE